MLVALPSVKMFFAGQGAKDELLTCFLSVGMEDVDVHGSVQALSNGLYLSFLELVVAADGLRRPVTPVQEVLKADMGGSMVRERERDYT